MIPLLLKIQLGGQNKKHRNIWIPLPLIYILLLILMVLISPLMIIGAIALLIVKGTHIFKAIPAFFKILTASSGLLIDIESQKENFSITIR